MIDFSFFLALLSLGIAITLGIELKKVQDKAETGKLIFGTLLRDLASAWEEISNLRLSVENMRATAGPLPPVLLRRTNWEQYEINMEMQPSEVAAVLHRVDSVQEIIKVAEERIATIERSRSSEAIRSHMTDIAVEILRHVFAQRADFEVQALRRLRYCETHVEAIEKRFDDAELRGFKTPTKQAMKRKS